MAIGTKLGALTCVFGRAKGDGPQIPENPSE